LEQEGLGGRSFQRARDGGKKVSQIELKSGVGRKQKRVEEMGRWEASDDIK